MAHLLIIRLFFLLLCTAAGYAIGVVKPELLNAGKWWVMIGFGFGGLFIAIEELIKGFSLRSFSATTVGLMLGWLMAWVVDQSGLFQFAEEAQAWMIRLGLFLGFGYIGMILALRSNKEEFTLIVPFVRFRPQNEPSNVYLLDTSAIIDGRIAPLMETRFLEGVMVIPRFVLGELQQLADSEDSTKRERGKHGLDVLGRIQSNKGCEVKIHESEALEGDEGVDGMLVQLARTTGAKLITGDYNLGRICELHGISCLRLGDLAEAMKKVLLPGEIVTLKVVREGRDKGQGVGYLNDGTMVVVSNGQSFIGESKEVKVTSVLQTGAGIIVFGEAIQSPLP